MQFQPARIAALIALGALCAPVAGQVLEDAVFTAGSRPAQYGVVTAAWAEPPRGEVPPTPMLQEIAGIAAVLNAREIRDLNRAIEPQTRIDGPIPDRIGGWTVHLAPRTHGAFVEDHAVRVRRTAEGWPIAISADRRTRLNTAAFDRISRGWRPTRPDPLGRSGLLNSGFVDPDDETATSPPATRLIESVQSPIRLDAQAISLRFGRGGDPLFAGTLTRSIEQESFRLTPPPDPIPGRPMGLIVWINPTERGSVPPTVTEAAARIGLAVVVSRNAGNTRPVVDRLQISLDAVASAERSIWLDRERIYVGGMSGGGRLASMLWAGAPDVFTGAVCVVGINSQHRVPTGSGTVWPASHKVPAPPLGTTLRPHPIAAISGVRDFNFTESGARIDALIRDGFRARLFDVPDLGHTLPNAGHLADAFGWIDRVVLERRAEAAEAGQALLDQIEPTRLTLPPTELAPRERRLLERVTLIAPWTEPAWEAAAALGYTAPTPPTQPHQASPTPPGGP